MVGHDDDYERWREKVRIWSASRDDCLWLANVEPYRRCRVAGVVKNLRIDPRRGLIEVTISDGRTSLVAEWAIDSLARSERPAPRQGAILEGIAAYTPAGRLRFVAPALEIVAGPEFA